METDEMIRVKKAIGSLNEVLHNLQEGNKRLAVGNLTSARESIKEVRWLLKDQIKMEDGEIK